MTAKHNATLPAFALTKVAAAARPDTIKAAKEALRAAALPLKHAAAVVAEAQRLATLRAAKQSRRARYAGRSGAQLPKGTPGDRLRAVRLRAVRHTFLAAFRCGVYDTLEVRLTAEPTRVGVLQREDAVWPYRGQYKAWRADCRTTTVTVPTDWLTRVARRELAIVDGMMTLDAAPLEGAPDGVELFAARWGEQGRGNEVRVSVGYIAREAGVSYHGGTPEKALAGLRRKRKAAAWEATLARADLEVLVAGHEDLSVRVSDARAVGACEYGIRSWCAAVGLDYDHGAAPLGQVVAAYQREPRPEARAAILYALRRARTLRRAA